MNQEMHTKKHIQFAMIYLANELEKNAERSGDPKTVGMAMTIPGTNCIFEFKIQHFYGDPPEMRTLTIDVRERGSDRMYSQFDFEGTEAEFIEYVRKPGYDCDDFYKRIIHLADRASQDD